MQITKSRPADEPETNRLLDGIQDLANKYDIVGQVLHKDNGDTITVLDYHGYINGNDWYTVNISRMWHPIDCITKMRLSEIMEG